MTSRLAPIAAGHSLDSRLFPLCPGGRVYHGDCVRAPHGRCRFAALRAWQELSCSRALLRQLAPGPRLDAQCPEQLSLFCCGPAAFLGITAVLEAGLADAFPALGGFWAAPGAVEPAYGPSRDGGIATALAGAFGLGGAPWRLEHGRPMSGGPAVPQFTHSRQQPNPSIIPQLPG